MPLFHPRVISKHINKIPPMDVSHSGILTAWADNLAKGIYDSETQNDGEFIQQILINVLGYVGSSEGKSWSVAKNQPINQLNVDVALGEFSANNVKIIAPFELKGAKTKDLDAIMAGRGKTPVQQAWEYANEIQGGSCQWVIVSNYREIRLYAFGYGKKHYESFDLSELSDPENYKRFMLLLSAENLLSGKTLGFLKESEQVDKDITDKLYADYKALRANLIKTLGQDNPDKDPLDIIKYTQTILDRVLFVAFAEDKGLLPKNTLKNAYETQNNFNPQPIWNNFKGLFHAIDKGNSTLKIPHYNGGLFAEDKELDSLSISDTLCEGFKKIGDYDFDSDVSVNILGHIFEQSISDLEELKAHADNIEAIDPKKSKRKKDGIFYTPAYITRYIVEQAVGGWLSDRRAELGFDKLPELKDEDYASITMVERGKRKGQITYNKKIEKHIEFWEAYKESLSNIKVLDPACGSGAFLNEVFDYLKTEGEAVNSELSILKGGQTSVFRWDTHILANNIYGVDLNNESVEITKLSLWLKTANRQEKLTYLEDNIKCGNSLIDDVEVAGENAFNWNEEFSEIMKEGGFDVVVGNPPYGAGLSKEEKNFIKNKYKVNQSNLDTYITFFELSLKIMKDNSYLGFITPNTFLVTENSIKIREFLLATNSLISLLEIFDVFPDAVVEPVIPIIRKNKPDKKHLIKVVTTPRGGNYFSQKISNASESFFKLDEILEDNSLFFNYRAKKENKALIKKIYKNSDTFEKFLTVKAGVKLYEKGKGTPPQTAETLKKKPFTSYAKIDKNWNTLVRGTDIQRYNILWQGEYVNYGEWLAAPRSKELFFAPKIIIRRTDDNILSTLDGENVIGINSVHCMQLKENNSFKNLQFYLAVLNSKLLNWVFQFNNFHMVGKPLAEVKIAFVERLPLAKCDDKNHKIISNLVSNILSEIKLLNELSNNFINLLQGEFNLEKTSRKLENWYELEFSDFVKEIEKSIKPQKLSLSQKAEWMPHFETEKAKAVSLKKQIDETDKEIDHMVYKLYDLTPEEIELIEKTE